MNNDYKNGYNEAIDHVLVLVEIVKVRTYESQASIYSTLRMLESAIHAKKALTNKALKND